jgi:hypothetical protein
MGVDRKGFPAEEEHTAGEAAEMLGFEVAVNATVVTDENIAGEENICLRRKHWPEEDVFGYSVHWRVWSAPVIPKQHERRLTSFAIHGFICLR